MRTQASYIKKKRSKNPRDGWTSRQSSAVNKRQGKSLLVLLTGLEIVKCVTKCVFPRKPSFERSWRFQVSSENSRVCVALPFHCCCSITKSCPALFATPWTAPCQAPLSSTVSWSLLKFMSMEWTISSSTAPFSFCLQSFPASGSFLMSWLFASGSQSTGASASASVLPVNI